jgi:hypothetical protein
MTPPAPMVLLVIFAVPPADATMVLELVKSLRKTTSLPLVAFSVPELVPPAATRRMPPEVAAIVPTLITNELMVRAEAVASMRPLLINLMSVPPMVPAPAIVLLTLIKVLVIPPASIVLFPLGDNTTLPPPVSVTMPET